MRIALMLILVLGLMIVSLPAIAEDGNNIPDQIGDIFSGKGNSYLGFKLINIPFIGPLTAEGWIDAMAGKIDDGVKRDVRGGFRAVADWQTIFK